MSVPLGKGHDFQRDKVARLDSEAFPLYDHPIHFDRVVNSLHDVPTGIYTMFMQYLLTNQIGKNHIGSFGGETLVQDLQASSIQHCQKTGSQVITREEVKNLTQAMIIYGYKKEDRDSYCFKVYLACPAKEYNTVLGVAANHVKIQATEGDIEVENMEIMGDRVTLKAGQKVSLKTQAKRVVTSHGFQDTISLKTKVIARQDKITAVGKIGYEQSGADVYGQEGFKVGCKTGSSHIGPTVKVSETTDQTRTEGGFFKKSKVESRKTTTETIESSSLKAGNGKGVVMCGKGCSDKSTLIAVDVEAPTIKFTGTRSETHAYIPKTRVETTIHERGSFTKTRQHSVAQTPQRATSTTIKSNTTILGTTEGHYSGTDFIGDVLYDYTKNGATFGPTIAVMEYLQQMVTQSPLAKSDGGIKGGSEVMQPCRIAVNQIIRKIDQKVDQRVIKFDSVDWVHKRPEIIGKFAETTYRLKDWQTSWNIQEQVIPNEALVVVALGVGLVTQGMGVHALSPLLKSITAATGMQLSTAGIAALNAGFSAVCSRMATSTLATGDLAGMAKDLTSKDGIKSIGISMASAGLCSKLGQVWGIDTNPSLRDVLNSAMKPTFTDFLKSQALKSGVTAGLNVAVGGANPSEAFASALKEAPLNAAAAWASYTIGSAAYTGEITPDQQDLLHSVVGAAYGAALNPDKPLKGAVSGAANAFVAAKASKIFLGIPEELLAEAKQQLRAQNRPLTEENIQRVANDNVHVKSAIPTILSAAVTAAISRDPRLTSTSASVTQNVTENNCIPHIIAGITALGSAYVANDVIKAGEEEGLGAAVDTLIEKGIILRLTNGALSFAGKVYSSTKAVWAAVVAKNPEAQKLIKAYGTPNAGGSIISFVTKKEEVYYRVYSGTNTSGAFLTKVLPKSSAIAQEGLALPSSNTAEFIQEVIVPAGVRLQRSRALAVPEWGRYRGSLEQFQVLNKSDLSKLIFKEGAPFQ